MEPIIVTDLKIIKGDKGAVLHGLKKSDPSFKDFGETYFSEVKQNVIKGWKRHTRMTLNLIAIVGEIEFFIYDNREGDGELKSYRLSQQNYKRLTIPPMVWVAFKGLGEYNLLVNMASIEHDPTEAENRTISEFEIQL